MEIPKKNLNYVFRVELDGIENDFSREIIVDSNDNLASLAYIILASVNANSHHMFRMIVKNNKDVAFLCVLLKDFQEHYIEEYLARDYSLWKFHLEEGDRIELIYGFGGSWNFTLTLIERRIEENRYTTPYVLKGVGEGIFEDGTIELFKNKIKAKSYNEFNNDIDKINLLYSFLKNTYEKLNNE